MVNRYLGGERPVPAGGSLASSAAEALGYRERLEANLLHDALAGCGRSSMPQTGTSTGEAVGPQQGSEGRDAAAAA